MKHSHRVYDAVKRVIDVAISAAALLLLSPVLAGIAIAVRVKLGAPVLFQQPRPGRNARIFTLYKFRSMRDLPAHTTAVDAVATDAERLTPFGRRLRSTSLDELPSFVNVLKGDMSLVGPRPLLPEYVPRYNEAQARRHEVRPGITGWAQVNGRNATSWEERFEMDVWYVDHRSVWLDLKIAYMTIATVFGRSGVSAPGEATMAPFDPAAQRKDDHAS